MRKQAKKSSVTAERMAKIRPILFLLTSLVAGSLLAYGIFREEIGEVMFNAAML